jgi:diguanylate cyclase (GGDEF)-like protein
VVALSYGGEEFMLVLPDSTSEAAYSAAERLRRAIGNDESEPRVTVSIGVASYPADGTDADELVRAADGALYASKNAGRDCVTRASEMAAPTA